MKHLGGWLPLSAIAVPDSATAAFKNVPALRERTLNATKRALDELISDDAAVFDVPVHRVGKVLAVGLNYLDHCREAELTVPTKPLLFGKFPSALTGPYDSVFVDGRLSQQVDYEVELAVIIGRRARSVAAADALSVVAGYAVANDVSARDVQFADGQWIRSKSFDGFCPLGPWVTTSDEISDPQSLRLSTRVNGVVRQDSSTNEMIFPVATLIEFLSDGITLDPGDVILTGTPAGVAMGRPDKPWLQPGDLVRCEIDGLGHVESHFLSADVHA